MKCVLDTKLAVAGAGVSAASFAAGAAMVAGSIGAGPAAAVGAVFGAVGVVAYRALSHVLSENWQDKGWKKAGIGFAAFVLAAGVAIGVAAAFAPISGAMLATLAYTALAALVVPVSAVLILGIVQQATPGVVLGLGLCCQSLFGSKQQSLNFNF